MQAEATSRSLNYRGHLVTVNDTGDQDALDELVSSYYTANQNNNPPVLEVSSFI